MAESAVMEPTIQTEQPRRISPAAHLAGAFTAAEVTGPRGVRLRETPFLTMIGVRVVPDTAAAAGIEASLRFSLPAGCGAVTAAHNRSVLWLSPDEFLVISDDDEPAEATAALRTALGEQPGSVIDLSSNRTTFELSGPSARAVLEKGCSLDLHPRTFTVGTAYVTLIGSVPVIVWRNGEDSYRILPRSSFADFLGRWLLDAMAEFKAPEVP